MENSTQKRIDITSISGYAVDVDSDIRTLVLYGTKTLGADFLVSADGTPTEGHGLMVHCTATITPGGYATKVFGTTINTLTVAGAVTTPRWSAICLYTNGGWIVIPLAYNIEPAGTTISKDANGNLIVTASSIEAAQIGATLTATIAAKALKTYVDSQDTTEAGLRVTGDAAAWSGISGDITVSAGGVSAIGVDKVLAAMIKDGDIVDAHLSASAAITLTKLAALTASEMVVSNASGKLVSAAVATYPSLTELTYVKGVTSAIQTQMNLKASIAYVDSAVGNITTFSVLNGTQTLTVSTIKKNHIIDSSGGATDITLPAAGTCVADQIVELMRSGVNNAGLIANAADQIVNIAGTDVATLALPASGNSVVLRCNGTDEWKVIRWVV
jgi:hypothetical protein